MAARILIIDDNAANVELMAFLLAAHGHTPLVAHDGQAGVEAAHGQQPDLVLCDVRLPGLDGYGVLAALRADPALADVPVLAATALDAPDERARLRAAGFDGYIGKPIEPASFAAEVEAFLPPAAPAAPTLLLVDDDRFMLEVLADFLAPEGYRILCAQSGEAALDQLARHDVQVILCDQCMPGMSGTELAAAARARHPHTWRIILSAQAEAGPIAAALQAGDVDGYLPKPWDGAALRAGLRAAFRMQRGRAPL